MKEPKVELKEKEEPISMEDVLGLTSDFLSGKKRQVGIHKHINFPRGQIGMATSIDENATPDELKRISKIFKLIEKHIEK